MRRQAIAHRCILEDVEKWSNEGELTFGFIIGQHIKNCDYIPQFITSNQYFDCYIQEICEIDEAIISEHAKKLTYMLPGGFCILGLFIITSYSVFDNDGELHQIRRLIKAIDCKLTINPNLRGKPPSKNYLVYCYDFVMGSSVCNELPAGASNVSSKSVEWLFNLPMHCWAVGNYTWNFAKPYIFEDSQAKLSALNEMIAIFRNYVENCKWTLNGNMVHPSEILCKYFLTSKKRKNDKCFCINIFMHNDRTQPLPLQENNIPDELEELSCCGVLTCKVFMHCASLVEDAVRAVQDDLIRSWASRLEIHWEYVKSGIPTMSHPRRILICNLKSKINFSHYLFSNENWEHTEVKMYLRKHLGVEPELCVMCDPHKKKKLDNSSKIRVKEEIQNSKYVLIVLSLSVLIGGMIFMALLQE